MENRANYVLVGAFTLVILALSFGFVYWSANVSDSNTRVPLIVRIEGSVTGLSQGSQVLFNGLAVGSVTNLRIDPNDPRVVIATTQVDRNTPITTSTQATIGFQGLTGIGFIGLSGGNANDRNIIASALEQGATPVIQANPSDVTDILATARDISDRANNILGEFERIVLEVGPAVTTTAANIARTSGNVDIFTASLAANADQIEDFVGSLGRLATSANDVALQLPTFIDQIATFVGALNSDSINESIENVAAITSSVREQTPAIATAIESVSNAAEGFGSFGETLSENSDEIDTFIAQIGPLSRSATAATARLDATLGSAQRAIGSAQSVIEAVDPADVDQTLSDIAEITRAVREQTPTLVSAIEAASTAIQSFGAVGDTINANIDAVERFLAALGPISESATSVAARLDTTLESVQSIADSIDTANIDRAIDNIANFTQTITDQNETITRAVAAIADASESFGAFGQAVRQNIAGIGQFLGSLGPIGERAPSIATNLDETLTAARGIVAAVDAEEVRTTVESVAGFTSALNERSGEVQTLISGSNIAITSLLQSLKGLDETRRLVDRILAGIDPDAVNRAVDNVSSATTNIAEAADSVGAVARDIGARREDIDAIITDAQATSANLREASAQVETVVASVDRFLNGPESEGLSSEARETLLAIQNAANAIRTGIAPISASVTNLSDQSLREVQSLVRETTGSISRVERAITDLANNPSRVITGGGSGGVREFDGRVRR